MARVIDCAALAKPMAEPPQPLSPAVNETTTRSRSHWPAPPGEAAYCGLAGDIVRELEPQTEADPIALLIHILVGAGNLIGRGPHFKVGAACHYANEDAICVGRSSSARKGTAKADVLELLREVDPQWADGRIMAGLSTGEGLIYAVRDRTEKQEPIRDKARAITGYQTVTSDEGITDKRLWVIEPEFASVLRVASRDGNTLSTIYRQAWDSGDLRVMNKNSPLNATGAHVSVIGHITQDELLVELSSSDKVNGFGNRNLWALVKRSKCLPDGGDRSRISKKALVSRLKEAVEFARHVGEMERDGEARELWHAVYPNLTRERSGLFGALTSRAEAHALRLSCIYALLDRSSIVRRCHLEAALALWAYCDESAQIIFGDSTGNRVADQLRDALRDAPNGLTRSEIREHFQRHRSASEIDTALSLLRTSGVADYERQESGGRPSERWFLIGEGAPKAPEARKGAPA